MATAKACRGATAVERADVRDFSRRPLAKVRYNATDNYRRKARKEDEILLSFCGSMSRRLVLSADCITSEDEALAEQPGRSRDQNWTRYYVKDGETATRTCDSH